VLHLGRHCPYSQTIDVVRPGTYLRVEHPRGA
jgi:hypothetical protein